MCIVCDLWEIGRNMLLAVLAGSSYRCPSLLLPRSAQQPDAEETARNVRTPVV